MTGLQKCAMFLLALGEHPAAQVLKHLDASTVNDISLVMSRMQSVDKNDIDSVLTEFLGQVDDQPTQSVDSLQFVRDTLEEALGLRKAEQVMEYIVRGDSMASTMDIVRRSDTSVLSEQMRSERPQVIALLLAHLDASAGAELLSRLQDDLAERALYRYARLSAIRPQVLGELAGMLGEQLSAHVGVNRVADVGGPRRAADILNNLPASQSNKLLEAVTKTDAPLAEAIRESMFVFGDLAEVEDRELQVLLHEVPEDQLVAALKATTEDVSAKLLSNVSAHTREAVQEDLASGRPVRRSEAESAQKAILQLARKLDQEHRINLSQNEELL